MATSAGNAGAISQLTTYLGAGHFPAAYGYIGRLIISNPALSSTNMNLATWFFSAASINRRAPSFLKDFIWTSNSKASIASCGSGLTDAQNQAISDFLARKVIYYVIDRLKAGEPINAQYVFDFDVGAAIEKIPEYNGSKPVDPSLWAGSILGLAYGFDVFAFGTDIVGNIQNIAELRNSFSVFKSAFKDVLGRYDFAEIGKGLLTGPSWRNAGEAPLFFTAIEVLIKRYNTLPATAQPEVLQFLRDLRTAMETDFPGGGYLFDELTGFDEFEGRVTRKTSPESGWLTPVVPGGTPAYQHIRYIEQPDHSAMFIWKALKKIIQPCCPDRISAQSQRRLQLWCRQTPRSTVLAKSQQ
jgi:hypothetical protein